MRLATLFLLIIISCLFLHAQTRSSFCTDNCGYSSLSISCKFSLTNATSWSLILQQSCFETGIQELILELYPTAGNVAFGVLVDLTGFNFTILSLITFHPETNCVGISPARLLSSSAYNNLDYLRIKGCFDQESIKDFTKGFPSIDEIKLQHLVTSGSTLVGLWDNLPGLKGIELTLNAISQLDSTQFQGLNSIQRLILNKNNINNLENTTFSHLTTLQTIELDYNNINLIHNGQFYGLSQLQSIRIQANQLTSLPSLAFEQLTNLMEILLAGNPLNCICDLAWVSVVSELYAIDFGAAECKFPPGSIPITSNETYTTCPRDNQECFDPSLSCQYDCVNTVDSYFCFCPTGYSLIANNMNCSDTNECGVSNGNCLHSCVNTEGSFYCTCDPGYQLSMDNFLCEDINECLSEESLCLYECINTIGSYSCSCSPDNSVSCICPPATDYCIHTESCLPDLSHCCPTNQYFCSVTDCCVDTVHSCPPTLPTNTSSPTVLLDGTNLPPLVVSIIELPSYVTCEFKVPGVSYTTAEYQNCDFEWQNCVTIIDTTSQVSPIIHTILSLTDFRFSRCLIRSNTHGEIYREFVVAPHFQSSYIAARSLASDPAIVYVLAGDFKSYCPDNCPGLITDLILLSDSSISLSSLSQVTIETQECKYYDSIYWMTYSLYKLKINFTTTSVLFQGEYTLFIQSTNIGSTSLNISFSYLSNAYCPAEFEYGVLWDVTSHSVTAAKMCSELLPSEENTEGLSRTCNAPYGTWSVVHSECYFPLEDASSKILIKVVLAVSQESYFSSLSRNRREISCPQSSMLLEQYKAIFPDINIISAEMVGYLDIILVEVTDSSNIIDSLIQNEIEPQLTALITANCYSQYWVSKIHQNTSLCACSSEIVEREDLYLCTEPACNCTDSGCLCNHLFAGDGTFCGPDPDNDKLPLIDLPCSAPECRADNCNMTSNPSQEDCNEDGIGDVCQEVCFAETDQTFNLSWPCTLKGETSKVQCTEINQQASRYCEGNNLWSTAIDTFNCTSPFYVALNNFSTTDALRALAQEIPGNKPVYSGDITISIDVLGNNLNRTEDPDETEKLIVIDDTLSVIDQLIDEEVIDVLSQSEIKVPVAERLIRIVDTHAINIVTQNTTVRFDNYSNLYFETVAITEASELSEPITLTASNLKFDTEQGTIMPEITLPTNTLSSDKNTGIIFFAKKNIGTVLFNYGSDITVGSTGLPSRHFSSLQIVSPLVSAQIIQGNKKITQFENGTVGIKLPFTKLLSENTYLKLSCVVITLDNTVDTFSTWNDAGLSESEESQDYIDCESMHLTSFAILAAINGLENQEAALTIVSYVGVGVSIICLALCIYIYLVFCQGLLKQAHHYTHFNLILSLLLLFIVFSVGLELPYRDNFWYYIPCKIASGLLQYLVLCLFAWMLAEGIIILILMQWPFYQFSWKYALFSTLLCWIIPGIYVAIYSIPLHNSFLSPTAPPIDTTQNSPGYCWIQSRDEYMYVHRHNLVVIVPIVGIIACNIVLFLFVITKAVMLYWGQKSFEKFTRSRKASISLLRLFVVLTPALGFLWILGLFTLDPASPFAWVFTIVGSLQGLFILIFVVLVRKDIRDLIVTRFTRIYSRVTSATAPGKNTSSRLASK